MSGFSPAADRNKEPILSVLAALLPERADVLEIASGTGQHAAHFAAAHPAWRWQPTEGDATALATILERTAPFANVLPPLRLDALEPAWPVALGGFDAVYCANLLHIAPWETCPALMRGAARHLRPGGRIVLYGPYRVDGEPLAPSNAAFDADLRRRDPGWGLRRLSQVIDEAARVGMALDRRIDMPACNLVLAWRAP